ncbi:S-layer homology domain-containing protein [Nodosilinea sp. LEGE 06152]|uniref:S-layer homology domain-containing protein n=1 Tax=Nodosilinea sp. LEGE 06152 TaxID=2777966 RepID=UPI0018822455|nr:S-layer homology domain-containing protein [Nodosilinea sp. LEGE 06152]MBE9156930.1 S-layer homology domain-containing protein [Nodosilinea sp. LEGE 06152]
MKRSSGAKPSARWRRLAPAGLAAIAAALALVTAIVKHPSRTKSTLAPVAFSGQARGFRALFNRSSRQSPPLTVPLPVLPQPLPPQQAWPDLPLVQGQPGFSDLNSGHWAWPILNDLNQRKVIAGFPDGTFRPADPMTRAEFATQLAQLFNLPLERSRLGEETFYTDMTPNHWAYGNVQQAVQMGFLSGYPDGTFLPDQTVSRIHVIVALANGLLLKSSRSATTALKPYSDQNQVPPWALAPLVAATEAGLVVNYPDRNQLAPNRLASRAEVAVMLHRALVYTGTLQDVPFPYVVGLPESN